MIIHTITSREDRATITAIIEVSSLLSLESELPEEVKFFGVAATVLEISCQDCVLVTVDWLSGSHVPFGETVVPTELVLTVLMVPLSEYE